MPRITLQAEGFRVTVETAADPSEPKAAESPVGSDGSFDLVSTSSLPLPPSISPEGPSPESTSDPLPGPSRVQRAPRVSRETPSSSATRYSDRRFLPVEPPFLSSSSVPEYPLLGSSAPGLPSQTQVPQIVLDLARHIRACNLTAEERISRAWQAGVQAGDKVRGVRDFVDSQPRLSVPNRVYCILQTSAGVAPQVHHSFAAYKAVPGVLQGPKSVSHAFPSEAEARAYFAGAGIAFPA